MSGPAVSVVIAAHNAVGHLERAVRSAIEQTLPPTEVIVVDDASTDDTLALARRLAEQHPTLRVLSLPVNGGPALARNTAIDTATGDWIAVLDADDAFTPGRLAALLTLAVQTGADVVFDNFVFRNEATGALRPSRIPAGEGHEEVDRYRFLAGARAFNYEPTWTLLQPVLRRAFLEQHGLRYPVDVRHGEDYLFMVDVFLAGARCYRARSAGYLYTERAQGVSTTRLDYGGLVRQTQRLLEDPRIRADPRARRLLRRRLASLRCLHAERAGSAALLRAAAASPGVAATLARRAGRRVGRRVRRTGPEPLPPLL